MNSFLKLPIISRFLLGGILFIVFAFNAKATHIVGGEMTYTCLGDDLYEIQLVIYRDCFFGNPNAYFDDPASIGVFNQNNVLIQEILVDLMGDDTLSQVLTNECLVIPPSVCVHTTTYRTVVELPPVIGGYQLAYQRCCRNQTIANIIEPLATGATFGVEISERALLECNSSATFLQWPPLYICANEPIFFDQSAIDLDGDSIVYRLCTPLQGANPDIPRPQPPNNPPYAEVNWNDPPYNTSNMLNGIPGGQVLTIDPVTGLLTGTPNTIGQFVVGICAEEYRDGELISTTRRDFQYNVGVCGQVTAAYFAPAIQCNGLVVDFENQSLGSNDYQWIFGNLNDPLGTSTEINPSFLFPDTGLFEITLIAEPDEFCRDTITQTVQLLPNSLMPAFSIDTLACGDSLWVQLTDATVDDLSTPQSWEWSLNGVVFSNEPDTELVLTEMGEYEITLLVTTENGCQREETFAIDALAFIDEELANDTLLLCPGDSVYLNVVFNENYEYAWSPDLFLNDPSSPNPLASPAESMTYFLEITDPENGCLADRSIHIEIQDALIIDVTEDIVTCADSVLLEVASNNGVRYLWATNIDFTMNVQEGTAYWVNPIGEQTYYVQVINMSGCVVMDSVIVNSQAVNLLLGIQDTSICLGESLLVSVENIDLNDDLSIHWLPEDIILSGQNTAEVSISTTELGEQIITYLATNQHGCTARDSVYLTVVDSIQLAASLSYQQCNENRVQFTSVHPHAALYQWHFGDPFAPDAQAEGAEVSYTYFEAGTYDVTLTLPEHLDCWDTLHLAVTILEDAIISNDFSWNYLSCSDTAVVVLLDETQTMGTEIIGWEWWLSDSLISNMSSAEWTIYANEPQTVQLITFAENGCIDTLNQLIDIPLIPFELQDSIQICPNEAVFLYPEADLNYDYEWSPSDYLDDPLAANPLATPIADIVYILQITDPNSICEREGTIFVAIADPIVYSLSPDTLICNDAYLLFVQSNQNLNYEWSANSDFTPLLSEENEWLSPIEEESLFYVQMTDDFGCSVIDSVYINSQTINLSIDTVQTICLGDTLQLDANASGGEGLIYQWFPSEGIIGASNTSSILISPTITTEYNLSVTNNAGCEAEASIQVNIFDFSPPLSIFPAIDTISPGETVQLLATDRLGYVYEWTPDESLSAWDVFNPFASPEESTTYHLMIRDANGCTNTAEAFLFVFNSPCQRPYIFVPNAFTPNADGLNDTWGVEGNTIETFHLSIYDRWGELIFESFNQADKWDGTINEKLLPPDVYGYYLEVSCIGGDQFSDKGNVSLIR